MAGRQHGAREQAFDETLHEYVLYVDGSFSGIQVWGGARRFANRDPLRDQAEPEEAVGDSLLGLDDVSVTAPIANEARLAATVWISSGTPVTSASELGHRVTVRFRPSRGLRQAVDDVAGVLHVGVREIAVGEIERIGLGHLIAR